MNEFRRSPRFGPLVVRAEFLCEQKTHVGFLTNLSEGGAFLATDETIPAGTVVPVQISLPRQLGQVAADAVVVWRNAKAGYWAIGVGIAFVRLTRADRNRLAAFLSRFRALPGPVQIGPLRPNGERLFNPLIPGSERF